MKKVNHVLHLVDKAVHFLKKYSHKNYLNSPEKQEIEKVVKKVGKNIIDPQYRVYFVKRRFKILVPLYSLIAFYAFLAIIALLIFSQLSFENAFLKTHQDYLFLILLLFHFALFAFNLTFLLLNISQQKLFRLLKIQNKTLILKTLLKLWEINDIHFLTSQKHFDVMRIEEILIYIPKEVKMHKIFLESTKNYSNAIYFKKQNVVSTFDQSFKNKQIFELLATKKMKNLFKKLEIDFNITQKSEIVVNRSLDIDQLLVIIFIVSVFCVYVSDSNLQKA